MENLWIIPVIILIVICIFLWKYGKFREEEETIYKKSMKCPWDNDFCAVDGRSIPGEDLADVCKRCPRHSNIDESQGGHHYFGDGSQEEGHHYF